MGDLHPRVGGGVVTLAGREIVRPVIPSQRVGVTAQDSGNHTVAFSTHWRHLLPRVGHPVVPLHGIQVVVTVVATECINLACAVLFLQGFGSLELHCQLCAYTNQFLTLLLDLLRQFFHLCLVAVSHLHHLFSQGRALSYAVVGSRGPARTSTSSSVLRLRGDPLAIGTH